jgi:hypothetical protein
MLHTVNRKAMAYIGGQKLDTNNDLATSANGAGWIAALAQLQSELETPQP